MRYIDALRPEKPLVPKDETQKQRGQSLIDLVHSADVDTNVILLQARDEEELGQRMSQMGTFMANRQKKLEKEDAAAPHHSFYEAKLRENTALYQFYSSVGPQHQAFFEATGKGYRRFASGMERLEKLLALPYANGDDITEADFHIVPWLSHAMMAAGTVTSEVQNLNTLQSEIRKSAPEFSIGPRTREWWANITGTASFRTVFPVLH